MEALQGLLNQLQFSMTTSQMIVSAGVLALAVIWGRLKIGVLLTLGTFAYWEYAANKSVLFQLALANTYTLFTTMFFGLFAGFLLVYALCIPSSNR